MIGRNDTDIQTGSSVSPISIQEQRILQVTNADLNPQRPQSAGTRTSSSLGRTSLDPQRDGKGRIMTKGERVPKVHLDGGRFQEDVAGSSFAPPAYSE
jgi:hypothetical protein